ncbi:MAG TPA: hypothetical protein VER14_08120 [Phototrophicaceae bacterium]|nr:hypothetical protein [Phototrophicaceae bacterium]
MEHAKLKTGGPQTKLADEIAELSGKNIVSFEDRFCVNKCYSNTLVAS